MLIIDKDVTHNKLRGNAHKKSPSRRKFLQLDYYNKIINLSTFRLNKIMHTNHNYLRFNLILLILLNGLISTGLKCEAARSNSRRSAEGTPTTSSSPISTSNADEELDGADLQLITQPFDYHSNMPVITKRELTHAIKLAAQNVTKLRDSLEPNLMEKRNLITAFGSIAWLAGTIFHPPILDTRTLNITYQALVSEEASKYLANKYKLSWIKVARGLPLISVDQTALGQTCSRLYRAAPCLAGQYRSQNGFCNNVQNPDWGSSNTPLIRYAPARYADHVSKPLVSSKTALRANQKEKEANLTTLPSSRAISLAILDANKESKKSIHIHLTTLMSFFGQFVVHDIAQVSQYTMGFGQWAALKCCGLSSSQRHPECMPIEYEDYCLDYVRSLTAVRPGCNLGSRDQLNTVSSYLDASTVYGSNEEQARNLRTFKGGLLRSTETNSAGELLPLMTTDQQLEVLGSDSTWYTKAQDCQLMAKLRAKLRNKRQPASTEEVFSSISNIGDSNCFQAGDIRVNENIGLVLMHTIWMREHNYIAKRLALINKHWQDERLYQEARRIVIAEIQHITYNELLPSILGQDIMNRFNLSILNQGYIQSYDPQINAGASNEFASTFLSLIKSTIPSALERYNEKLENIGGIQMSDSFMNGGELMKQHRMAQYLIGMISQNAMEPAQGVFSMSMDLSSSNKSSNNSEAPKIDFIALTIQRMRDHGMRGYLYWRDVCKLTPKIRSWDDLEQVMPGRFVERLSQVYLSPLQLDLYAAHLETPFPGSAIGPTLVCIIARQFYHIKHGDRYWFENDLPSGFGSFSPDQLDQIRQTSMAKVLCRNSDSGISFVQPSPMITSDPFLNAYQYCTNKAMDPLDFSKWQEPLTTVKQLDDELFMNELHLAPASAEADQSVSVMPVDSHVLAADPFIRPSRGRRSHLSPQMIDSSILSARNQFEDLAYQETRRMRAIRSNPVSHGGRNRIIGHPGYRYLGRPKRQTLLINNQSLLLELATNDIIRSLLHQGKDRENAQTIQGDLKDFLVTLETIQLDNLLDNSVDAKKIQDLVTTANSGFLTPEQRAQLVQLNDPTIGPDPLLESTQLQTISSSIQNDLQCQDDTRIYPCDHTSPFRTMTGWCNNLNHPRFGQSFTQHDRLLPSAYEDGFSKPRSYSVVSSTSANKKILLPSPRLVSTSIHDSKSKLHARYSLALMQFGQFAVDHDLTRTPFGVGIDGSLLDCSPCDARETVHRDCIPIPIPDQDPFYHSQQANQQNGPKARCLHFVRSLNGQIGLGPRQQINALTSYFDGSEIYGSDNCEAKSLRSFQGGKLNSSVYLSANLRSPAPASATAKELLPITKANPECVTPGGICFHAGDQRASEQPSLSAIHTIFMRLHNYIVTQLSSYNKQWNDEKLYQHGRRIVGAILQRIAYNEFVPRLLGLDYVSKYDLLLKETGYSDDYDESCSASIINEFASAAFRVGHSLIRNAFPLLDRQYKQVGQSIQLRKAFFNTQRILSDPQVIDSIMRGIVSTPIESADNSVSDELTNHLFEKAKEPFSGMDLISLNIQRARDHGISGYNNYRVKCNLTKAKNFEDLRGEISSELVTRLQNLYEHVDDIDLFTGGLSEQPVHGGLVGPTFACIIGLQFQRLKKCDRFWHETNDPWIRFSAPQLAEIRKMTLAKVLCQMSDSIDTIQRNAMDVNDNYL